jgi:alkyl sulfatase BDS1-like metallo-beta-lactamase superfamily hydrolase
MDLITLTYDQTLRGILRGLGPNDLRYFIYKPKRLAEPYYNAESYGETPWFPEAVYDYQMGWFDRDVAKIYRLPPSDAAARLIELMGGRDKVVEAAKAALAKKEYAWALELVEYVYRLDLVDNDVRRVKVEALRKMGQLSFGSIGRSFYLSEARGLEGKEQIPRLVPPTPAVIAADPTAFVNYHRVRIDPQKVESIDKVLAFQFPDKTVGLHVRSGIAEFADFSRYYRKPDLTVRLDGATVADLYLNSIDLDDALKSGKAEIVAGGREDLRAVLDLFDRFSPAGNITIPPGSPHTNGP